MVTPRTARDDEGHEEEGGPPKRPTIVGDVALAAEAARLTLTLPEASGTAAEGRPRSSAILRQGLLRHEMGWLRGSRACWVQLRTDELLVLEPRGQTLDGCDSALASHDLQRRLPLESIDALAAVGCRVRLRLSDGVEVVLLAETAGDAQVWIAAPVY